MPNQQVPASSMIKAEQSKRRKIHRGVLFGQPGMVKIHFTLKELSVKLDKRIPTDLKKRLYLSRA